MSSATRAGGQPSLSKSATQIKNKKTLRVVAFGDSISEVGRSVRWNGGASAPANNWAQRLRVMLQKAYAGVKVEVTNAGIGGQNSYEGLGRVDTLEALKPDLVLVEFGANDCCYHFLEPEQTQAALKSLAETVKQRFGADVVIMGTAGDNPLKPFFQHRDETIAATKAAASESGVLFVDVRAPILTATENGKKWAQFHLSDENCHPNDQGHVVWAQAVFDVLRPHLKP